MRRIGLHGCKTDVVHAGAGANGAKNDDRGSLRVFDDVAISNLPGGAALNAAWARSGGAKGRLRIVHLSVRGLMGSHNGVARGRVPVGKAGEIGGSY